jgi:glycosyltransferase involved in cell wall biosynthesis
MNADATLITICWNAAATIQRTLDSILKQNALPAQYLVVDGGSTDGTLEILEAAKEKFLAAQVDFRVLPQQRVPGEAGIPNAWNQALRLATGDFVAILNADDWYENGVIDTVEQNFRKTNADAVVLPVTFRDDDGKVVRELQASSFDALPWKMVLPHPGCFFRRRVYEQLGLYDTRYRISADYDFVWRCFKAGIRWNFLQDKMINMQAGGLADTGRKCARRETMHIAKKYCRWYDFRPEAAFLLRTITGR